MSDTIQERPKNGLLTTEFWVTVVTLLLPLGTLVLHRDLSDYVQVIAFAASAVATAAYAISRALAKSGQVTAKAIAANPH